MKIEQALLLVAALGMPGAADAQMCSGGPGGGVDATGNDCTWAEPAGDEVDAEVWKRLSGALAHRAGRMDGTSSARSSARAPSLAAKAPFDPLPAPHPCSGGTEGGMDATGNACARWLDGAGDIDSRKWAHARIP